MSTNRASRLRQWMLTVFGLVALIAASSLSTRTAERDGGILITEIRGAIGVAATRLVVDAIAKARQENARYLVIHLDTPGGLVAATRDIVRQILTSPIPVIVYVSPGGARAASAGTFIVYAAHVAAMAPGTNIGAATPVDLGGLPGLPRPTAPQRDEKDKDKANPAADTAAQRKTLNDTIAMLRSLAQLRGRNVEWAEKAVRDAATLTAEDALKESVIDVVALGLDDLLTKIDGRKITINAVEHTITTNGATRIVFGPDWRTRLLGVISDPNVAFILLLIGMYGILFEFWNPGGLVAGVIGAVCLLLGLTALTALPVQYAALGLIVLGIALMITEVFTPGLGILGIGGLTAFVTGSLFLFDPAGADIDISVSLPLIIASAATTGALALFALGAAVTARSRPALTGAEQMIGSVGEVIEWSGLQGRIRVHGEMWNARAKLPFAPGDAVLVVQRENLTLLVTSK
ncbi:nodulation protein NfeD [Bradyrhizobium sp.]|uniref:NfeD family protein n=1 Tax=Bradyrhizobium sp. TaxID=376 RepID=UPI002735BEED|nr:nodulation protein NfeD [Bradyrhizobium sp.]MDP3074926.1 nodulation protein NfeD [Bradyrhizobium sp.]